MNQAGSDKGLGWHNYTNLYYELFKNIKNNNLNIFEMGIGTTDPSFSNHMGHMGSSYIPGGSIRGWIEFFPNSMIYAADIDQTTLFENDRIKTFYCDQTDDLSIKKMWEETILKSVEFDIFIDDGFHDLMANFTLFKNSFHKLKKTGYYIIEDIKVNLIPDFYEKFGELQKHEKINFTIYDIYNPVNRIDNSIMVLTKI
jgi:hypothetical protein